MYCATKGFFENDENKDYEEIFKIILEKKEFNINAVDDCDKNTSFYLAVSNDNLKIAKMLFGVEGLDVNLTCHILK